MDVILNPKRLAGGITGKASKVQEVLIIILRLNNLVLTVGYVFAKLCCEFGYVVSI